MRAVSRGDLPLVLVAVVAIAVTGVLLLKGSEEEGPYDSYCSAVEEHRSELGSALNAGKETGLLRALPAFEDLASKAPDDIRDEWRIVIDRITELQAALDAAGVDAASYDFEKPPADMAADDRKAIEAAATRLGSADTATALTGVEQQARDVCKSPLSL
ncbi:MAG TPA: hypothetical protein VM575_00460 [Nocardioides sp.]|nr:hypothetical protein [Nocardioides sp.]